MKGNRWLNVILVLVALTLFAVSASATSGPVAGKAPDRAAQPQAIGWPNKWPVYFSGDSQWSKSAAGNVYQETIRVAGTARVECDDTGLNCITHVSQNATYLSTLSTLERLSDADQLP